MSKASVIAAYGRAPKTPVPAGRQERPTWGGQHCCRCECPVIQGGVPDCPTDCDCHHTALRWLGGPSDLKESPC